MPIVSREVAGSIIEEIYINKEKRGNSNTMILNGDDLCSDYQPIKQSKEKICTAQAENTVHEF